MSSLLSIMICSKSYCVIFIYYQKYFCIILTSYLTYDKAKSFRNFLIYFNCFLIHLFHFYLNNSKKFLIKYLKFYFINIKSLIKSKRLLVILIISSNFFNTASCDSTITTPLTVLTQQEQEINISTKTSKPIELDYDINLFYELNMLDTVQNLFRSCFKDSYSDLKEKLNLNQYQQNFQVKEVLINELIKKLLNRDLSKLSPTFLDLVDSVCLASSNLNEKENINSQYFSSNKINGEENKYINKNSDLINKLYLLSDYEHHLCGNIFRNSISRSNLNGYILKLNEKQVNKPEVRFKLKKLGNHKIIHDEFESSLSNNTNHLSNYIDKFSSSKVVRKLYQRDTDNNDIMNLNNGTKSGDILKLKSSNATNILDNYMNHFHHNHQYSFTTKHAINNCTLLLLNVYLLAFKSSCDYESFAESLNHYDCHSNNFSVKSNCDKCQNAYKKWSCSSNIPYFENERIAKPCQRYCYDVQNMCPFFRPVDTYGGQPVFHCRNVVQVVESKLDGLEDDDENYYDDDKNDEDICYSECGLTSSSTSELKLIPVDLNIIFKENVRNMSIVSTDSDLYQTWLSLYKINSFNRKENDVNSNNNSSGRYFETNECLYNLVKFSSSLINNSSSFSFRIFLITKYQLLLIVIFICRHI